MSKYELVALTEKRADSSCLRIRALGEQEYQQVRKAVTDVLQFRSRQSLYEICDRNYYDLQEFVRNSRDHFTHEDVTEQAQYDVLLEINRRIMNYLSGVRIQDVGHHVVMHSLGGLTNAENCVLVHDKCHDTFHQTANAQMRLVLD